MNISKDNKNILLIVVILLGFLSLFLGAHFGEDALGGAKNDYLFHEKYIFSFSENFSKAINEFGENYQVRNSPIFFIYSSYFIKFGVDILYLKYFNLIIILPLVIFFIKSLDIKFENLNIQSKAFLTAIIFISPTIRSLSAWPYPLTWAICFFLVSIFYFLKFQKSESKRKKIKYSLLNVLFLAISAYFTPNFGIFAIFFLFYFLQYFKFSKESFIIILFNIALSLPALYFLVIKDFYLFKHEIDNVITDYTIYDTLNISNKIIIISSIIFFFFIPFIEIKKIDKKKLIKNIGYIFIFILINIYFFNFREGLGGGLFYHLSNVLFGSPILLFIIFSISLFIFKNFNLLNYDNSFLFLILILYNIQSTIYYKYYDPIIYFILLFLIRTKSNFNLEIISKKNLLFYLFFLSISFGKKFIIY